MRLPRFLFRRPVSGFRDRPAPVVHSHDSFVEEEVVCDGRQVVVSDDRKTVPYVKFTHDASAERVVVNGIEVVAP